MTAVIYDFPTGKIISDEVEPIGPDEVLSEKDRLAVQSWMNTVEEALVSMMVEGYEYAKMPIVIVPGNDGKSCAALLISHSLPDSLISDVIVSAVDKAKLI